MQGSIANLEFINQANSLKLKGKLHKLVYYSYKNLLYYADFGY